MLAQAPYILGSFADGCQLTADSYLPKYFAFFSV
jgi:hypothetical protein